MQTIMKYALVTGASGGIGREFAVKLAAEGWAIILVGRNEGRLEAARASLSGANAAASVVLPCDLSTPGAAGRLYRACAERGLSVDLLVNNAGSGVFGDSLSLSPEAVEAMVNLNICALTNLCALFGRDMKARGSGRILNVGSFAGLNATPYFASYAASKSYVLDYTLALRAELSGSGVVVTCLLPGYVRTDFDDNAGIESEAYKKFAVEQPRRRGRGRYRVGRPRARQGLGHSRGQEPSGRVLLRPATAYGGARDNETIPR